MSSDEKALLKKILSGKGRRLRDGTYLLSSQEEYDTAKNLQEKGLVRIFGSNGIMSGFPWTAVEITPKRNPA